MTLARPLFPKYQSRTFSAIPLVTYANHNKKIKGQKILPTMFTKKTHKLQRKKTPEKALSPRPAQNQNRLKNQQNPRIYCTLPNVITQQKQNRKCLEPTEQNKLVFHTAFHVSHFNECVRKQDTSALYTHSSAGLNQKEIINLILNAKLKGTVHGTITVL